MRKTAFIIMTMLASLGLLSACNNDDGEVLSDNSKEEQPELYFPIEEGEGYATISNFFRSNYNQDTEYRCFFEGVNESQCIVIDNTDELLSKYTGVGAFPYIDFNKFMLIVGQEMMPESYYTIIRQELLQKKGELELNIYVPKLVYSYSAFQHLFYWGLYPKMQHSKISVKIHKEK